VKDEEALKARAKVGDLADTIHDVVDDIPAW